MEVLSDASPKRVKVSAYSISSISSYLLVSRNGLLLKKLRVMKIIPKRKQARSQYRRRGEFHAKSTRKEVMLMIQWSFQVNLNLTAKRRSKMFKRQGGGYLAQSAVGLKATHVSIGMIPLRFLSQEGSLCGGNSSANTVKCTYKFFCTNTVPVATKTTAHCLPGQHTPMHNFFFW